ncbi:hypothetical protein CHAN_10595 [Corynebacterium hansenii]|nr:hypothetical protein CHAN_10595 [Corynebacterium hansenii]
MPGPGGGRESLWRRAVREAKQAAGDRTTFRPIPLLVVALIVWAVIAWSKGMDAALPLLAAVIVLAYPVMLLIWGIVFVAVFGVSLVLLPVGDAVDAHFARRSRNRHVRRD